MLYRACLVEIFPGFYRVLVFTACVNNSRASSIVVGAMCACRRTHGIGRFRSMFSFVNLSYLCMLLVQRCRRCRRSVWIFVHRVSQYVCLVLWLVDGSFSCLRMIGHKLLLIVGTLAQSVVCAVFFFNVSFQFFSFDTSPCSLAPLVPLVNSLFVIFG